MANSPVLNAVRDPAAVERAVEFLRPHTGDNTHHAEQCAMLYRELSASPWVMRALTGLIAKENTRCLGKPGAG